MKKYEKPVVMINEELAEGVYAASGVPGGDCWDITVSPTNQDYVDGYRPFRVNATHKSVKHISGATVVTIVFNYTLTGAKCENTEWTCSWSGNTLTITRPNHGNAYSDGDTYNYGIWASTGDEATTKALATSSYSIYCQYAENVQGEGGDGT